MTYTTYTEVIKMINNEQAANNKYPVPRELDGVYTRIIRDGNPYITRGAFEK